MRDPKVFGVSLKEPSDDTQAVELALVLDPLPGKHAETQYGTALSNIQRNDLEKCSSERLYPQRHSSRPMPLQRLSSELKRFVEDHPEYISIAPIDGNICNLLGSIEGPPGTPYEGGIFFIRMDCLDSYPVTPPVCNFMTKIYHPNISQGRISVNILEDAWSPVLSLRTTLLSICSLLSGPFYDRPLDKEIAAEYKKDKTAYEDKARLWTRKYATGSRPTDDELDGARKWNKILAEATEKKGNGRRNTNEDFSSRADGLW